MAESKADLILHPIRMRIIQALLNGRRRTTQQLVKELEEIPQATMYRHLSKLLKAGVLEVAEENKVRGAVEKVYYLSQGGEDATPSDTTERSAGEHMALFQKFVSSLVGDFSAYVRQEKYDLQKDGVSMRQVQLHLTDDEYAQLLAEMRQAMQKYAGNEPGSGHRRRMISTIVIPGAPAGSSEGVNEGEGQEEP
ncbi:DNA-binding transcriptional ArsR family regulator [Paenibacillus forsythiae]|uniref:DNA-binding transcriptional ArsR family regulator n=1 Tax=Paenibacillus forsythiae TaxID=365616 RepID=A0ABU3H8T1_9BACL|nr:helix-turn-helix domain-containing protein [Paenibacillus forsythiae]MDT3427233.1 DNA-binding transcriptional ArsR family regulator [Paenibacillus forsythiae]